MINQKDLRPKDMGILDEQLIKLEPEQLMPLSVWGFSRAFGQCTC